MYEYLGRVVFLLFFALIFGYLCQGMAKKRNRNTRLGFWLGFFFFGLFAVIGYAIAGKKKVK